MSTPLLVKRSEIDIDLWDKLIKKSDQRCVYGYSWYLDCVSPNWSAIVWPSLTEYSVVIPLPIVRKWGLSVVQQPFFCQYLGFFSNRKLSEELVRSFLQRITDQFIYISSYSFNPGNTELLSNLFPVLPDFITRFSTTHLLPLTKPYTELYNGYSTDRKNNLRRSVKESWKVEYSNKFEPLLQLFETNHAYKIPGGVDASSYELLLKLHKELEKRRLCLLSYALKDYEIHAGYLIVREGDHHIYLFNAADEMGRKGNARTFLLDKYLRSQANKSGFFDFESPADSGIITNYLSYGAEEVNFYTVRKNKLPFPLRKWQEKRILKSITKR